MANAAVLNLIQSIPVLQPDPPSVATGGTTTVNEGGLQITKQQQHVISQANQLAALNPNAAVLWPGSLIQGKSIAGGDLAPIPCDRTGTTASLVLTDLTPLNNKADVTVQDPTQGSIQDAVNSLVTQAMHSSTPAKFSVTVQEFYSLDQAMMSLGISGHWMSGSAHASLSMQSDDTTHNYVAQISQEYYTINVETPTSPDQFFNSGVTAASLQDYIAQQNPPAYVSSVTFGRQLYLFARSHTRSDTLKAALNASFTAGTGGGTVDLSAENKAVLSESDLTVFAIGGAAGAVISQVTGNSDQRGASLAAYVAAGANFDPDKSPGMPLSYVCRWLRDSTDAVISFSTDYTINTQSQIVTSDPQQFSSGIFGEREDKTFTIKAPDGFMWDNDINFVRSNLQQYDRHGGAMATHSFYVDGIPFADANGLHVTIHEGWGGSGSESVRVAARFISNPNS